MSGSGGLNRRATTSEGNVRRGGGEIRGRNFER